MLPFGVRTCFLVVFFGCWLLVWKVGLRRWFLVGGCYFLGVGCDSCFCFVLVALEFKFTIHGLWC